MWCPLPCGLLHGSRARLAGRQDSVSDTAVEIHQLFGLPKGRGSLIEGSWLTWGVCYLLNVSESRVDETREEREITQPTNRASSEKAQHPASGQPGAAGEMQATTGL